MFRAIKLYGKETVLWNSESRNNALQEVIQLQQERVQHEIQLPKYKITESRRKTLPFNVEFTYYDFETIKEIVKDKEKK